MSANETFSSVEPGGTVIRMLAGSVPMPLKVTAVTEDRIICGAWEFDRKTGAEIDDDLGWGPPPKTTGSFIQLKETDV